MCSSSSLVLSCRLLSTQIHCLKNPVSSEEICQRTAAEDIATWVHSPPDVKQCFDSCLFIDSMSIGGVKIVFILSSQMICSERNAQSETLCHAQLLVSLIRHLRAGRPNLQ